MLVPAGITQRTISVRIVDGSGLPVLGLVAATFPDVFWQLAGPYQEQVITLVDLSTNLSGWVSGGVIEISGGYYRLDLPDAVFSPPSAPAEVDIIGYATGMTLLAKPIVISGVVDIQKINGTVPSIDSISGAMGVDLMFVDGEAATAAGPVNFNAQVGQGNVLYVDGAGLIDLTSHALTSIDTQLSGTHGSGAWGGGGGSSLGPQDIVDAIQDLTPTNPVPTAGTLGAEIASGGSGITGTAQSGTSTTITLASGDTAATGLYVGQQIILTGGTGAGQVATVTAYDGPSKLATITAPFAGGTWLVTPDNTTTYRIPGFLATTVRDVTVTTRNVTVSTP